MHAFDNGAAQRQAAHWLEGERAKGTIAPADVATEPDPADLADEEAAIAGPTTFEEAQNFLDGVTVYVPDQSDEIVEYVAEGTRNLEAISTVLDLAWLTDDVTDEEREARETVAKLLAESTREIKGLIAQLYA